MARRVQTLCGVSHHDDALSLFLASQARAIGVRLAFMVNKS